jgi:5-(carboxyamino)imidazole ribonucleotide mutase
MTSTTESRAARVAIVMGSDSDLAVMRQAASALDEFGIGWEMRVLSAHRTPDDTVAYARSAAERGLQVIIAGAGGAAHLAGVIAAVTRLPVIGVPIALAKLDGLDSLLSMVQMPKGIPVAAVAIDGARNAGLLAARVLGLSDPSVAAKLDGFAAQLANEVRAKDAKLQRELEAERRGDRSTA